MIGPPPSIPWPTPGAAPTGAMENANANRVVRHREYDAANIFEAQKKYTDWAINYMRQLGWLPGGNASTIGQAPIRTFEGSMAESFPGGDGQGKGSTGWEKYVADTGDSLAKRMYDPIARMVAATEAKYGQGNTARMGPNRGFAVSPAMNTAMNYDLAKQHAALIPIGQQAAQQVTGQNLAYNNQAHLLNAQLNTQRELDDQRLKTQLTAMMLGGFQYSPLSGFAGSAETPASQFSSQGFSGFDFDTGADKRNNPGNYDNEPNQQPA